MSDELLSEIVATERDIRRQISSLEEELAARLATLRAEVAEELQREAEKLEAELVRELEDASRAARGVAKSLVAEAEACAATGHDPGKSALIGAGVGAAGGAIYDIVH